MEAIKASSSENAAADRMVEIELEAAEALAGLAHVAANMSESHGGESVDERIKAESGAGNLSFDPVAKRSISPSEDQVNCDRKNSEKTCIWTVKSVMDATVLGSNATYPTKYASSKGRKSRQSLTEAEKEARRIRRVLANRESARQTIRRRQAIHEELTRKAADLACVNKNLRRKKEMASREYDSLKRTNECLKAQMIKIVKVKADEIHGESRTSYDELNTCFTSTSSPFIMCSQSSFFQFICPSLIEPTSSVQLHFPSHSPISATNSSSEKGNSVMSNGVRSPLYLFPYPWVFAFPQNDNEHCPSSFNLNDEPIESSPGNLHSATSSSKTSMPAECQLFFPRKVEGETSCSTQAIPIKALDGTQIGFPSDGGGPLTAESNPRNRTLVPMPKSCVNSEDVVEYMDANTPSAEQQTNNLRVLSSTGGDKGQIIHQVPVVCSGKKLCNMAAAADARRRRKQLKKQKDLHWRQLQMHQVEITKK